MPRYLEKSLPRRQCKPQTTSQNSPHYHTPFKFGVKGTHQYTNNPDTSPLLSPKDTIYIQSITGKFLYYVRVIDYNLLPTLNELSSQQAQLNEGNRTKSQHIMDYVATYPPTFVIMPVT